MSMRFNACYFRVQVQKKLRISLRTYENLFQRLCNDQPDLFLGRR